MAGARNWDVRLPGDPPAEVPEPWFIRQAREGLERQSSRTVPDWPDATPAPRTRSEDLFDDPGPPPPPDAARKAALQAVMVDTARRRANALKVAAAALLLVIIAVAVGWTLRGLVGSSTPEFAEAPPSALSEGDRVSAPVAPAMDTAPADEPDYTAPAPAPVEVEAAPRIVDEAAPVPPPVAIVAAAPAPSRVEPRPVPAAPRREAPRAPQRAAQAPVAVASAPVSPRVVDPACAQSASRGLRFVCGDAVLGALDRDYAAASARIAALDDPTEMRRFARDDQRFVDRRDRCDDAACVADRYEDRLASVEARLRRVERRRVEVADGGPTRLPECKGFQIYRPTTPCTTRRGSRD